MKTINTLRSTADLNLDGLIIETSHDSLLVTVKRNLYIPEKKIILLDQVSEQESRFLNNITKSNGGFIV